MSEIIERLRAHHGSDYMCQDCYGTTMDDAADEIERLTAENERLRAALKPLTDLPVGAELFIDLEYNEHGTNSLDTVLYKNGGKAITARDIMNARTAFQQKAVNSEEKK